MHLYQEIRPVPLHTIHHRLTFVEQAEIARLIDFVADAYDAPAQNSHAWTAL